MPAAPHYLLFSESCCRGGGQRPDPAPGHWRFVLESVDGTTRVEADDEERECDPGRLDLLAVVRGLEALDQPSRVTLVTPSRYVTRGLRFGLEQWRENGWQWERFGEMARVKNWDLWQRIDRAMSFHQVECRTWRFDLPEDQPPRRHLSSCRPARTECTSEGGVGPSRTPGQLAGPRWRVLTACGRVLGVVWRRCWPGAAPPWELRAA